MSLGPGTRIGVYEIITKLGEGGMGEVYRARDTKLGREVAIKVLPATVSGHADRLARFEREARTLASLNHPNIAQVFGLEDAVSVAPGGTSEGEKAGLFLIMELLEGTSLADVLADGALPTRKATDYGGQIARGLSAAHERGIIHRDLKPDNIFVLPDGRVKILDFGLARQADASAASPAATMLTRERFTDPGTVMGTAGYMAPEQVRAEPTDARSDLFSLGVVLYEMLAGRRAFRKDTTVETMAATLREDPVDLATLRTDISPALLRIVHRCIEKSPSARFQTASDLAFALDAISGSTHGSGTQVIERSAITPATPAAADTVGESETRGKKKRRKERSRRPLTWAVIGMTFGLGFFTISRVLRDSGDDTTSRRGRTRTSGSAAGPAYRASVIFPEGVKVTELGGEANCLAISPDGTKVAFIGGSKGEFRPPDRLWILTLGDGTVREMEGTLNATAPIWSLDSEAVFYSDRAAHLIKRIAIAGGQPVTVANRAGTIALANDGTIVGYEFPPSPLGFTVPSTGGQPTTFFSGIKGQLIGYPVLLDDQRHFLVANIGGPGALERPGLYVLERESDAASMLAEGDHVNSFIDSGYLLYNEGRNLVARQFDQETRQLDSASTTLADDLTTARNAGAVFSASKNGTLVYVPQPNQQMSRLMWVDRQGKNEVVLGDVADFSNVQLSPDDTRVAVSAVDPTSQARDLFVVDISRGVRQRLTFSPGQERSVVWTPDGRRLVYQHDGNLFERASDFTGSERSVLNNAFSKDPSSVSADGTRLLYRQSGPQGNDIWEMPLTGDRTPRALLNAAFDENYAGYSPDGKSMVYMSDEAGRPEVYVMSLDGSGGKTLISNQGGMFPKWRRDGREIAYLRPDQTLMAVAVTGSGATFKASLPTELFHITRQPGAGTPFDISKDGKRFIVNQMVASRIPPSLTLIVNWPSLVQKLTN